MHLWSSNSTTLQNALLVFGHFISLSKRTFAVPGESKSTLALPPCKCLDFLRIQRAGVFQIDEMELVPTRLMFL